MTREPQVGEVWELDPEDNNRLTALVVDRRVREDDLPVVDVLVLEDLLYPGDVGHVKEWLLKEFIDDEEPVWRKLT